MKNKKLIIVNGTMGVGKTTTCNRLNKILDKSIFLDGDWCWNMDPFIVNDKTKEMVEENIAYLLNNFVKCDEIENIIFCWVIHKISILENILKRLNSGSFDLHIITLTCNEEALKKRIQHDIDKEMRSNDVIERSVEKSKLYEAMPTQKIDTSHKSIEQVTSEILELIGNGVK